MGERSNITVILPIHEINDKLKAYFENAVKSVQNQIRQVDELLIVIPTGDAELEAFVSGFDYNGMLKRIVLNDGKTDFASQVNFGVEQANTEWVSFLEVDDEMSTIWIKNVVEHINAYEDVEIFLPIIVDVDENGSFAGFTNETVWANDFSDEMGMLDHETLLKYQNYNFDGMVIKKETYQSNGGIKPTIKLTFIYEFFLRMTHFGVPIMTIPKLGYKHVNQRPGALFNTYKDTMDSVEAQWWMSLAKRECHQTKARDIQYEESQD